MIDSSSINDKEALKKAVIGNQSNADQNMLQGEIAVINTSGKEGIYTLNSDGTDMIEYSPISKEEKEQINTLITNGVAITEAPKDGKNYSRNNGTWVDTTFKIVTESEYTALGETVNTDGVLYFVTPD